MGAGHGHGGTAWVWGQGVGQGVGVAAQPGRGSRAWAWLQGVGVGQSVGAWGRVCVRGQGVGHSLKSLSTITFRLDKPAHARRWQRHNCGYPAASPALLVLCSAYRPPPLPFMPLAQAS